MDALIICDAAIEFNSDQSCHEAIGAAIIRIQFDDQSIKKKIIFQLTKTISSAVAEKEVAIKAIEWIQAQYPDISGKLFSDHIVARNEVLKKFPNQFTVSTPETSREKTDHLHCHRICRWYLFSREKFLQKSANTTSQFSWHMERRL
jgi:hypothetical protein